MWIRIRKSLRIFESAMLLASFMICQDQHQLYSPIPYTNLHDSGLGDLCPVAYRFHRVTERFNFPHKYLQILYGMKWKFTRCFYWLILHIRMCIIFCEIRIRIWFWSSVAQISTFFYSTTFWKPVVTQGLSSELLLKTTIWKSRRVCIPKQKLPARTITVCQTINQCCGSASHWCGSWSGFRILLVTLMRILTRILPFTLIPIRFLA